jgi:hypothetical protein
MSRISEEIKAELSKDHSCYVLVTCNSPSEDGKMQVEMSYEGDPILAAYLLQGAQSFLEEQESEE